MYMILYAYVQANTHVVIVTSNSYYNYATEAVTAVLTMVSLLLLMIMAL